MDAVKDAIHAQLAQVRTQLEGVQYLQQLEDKYNFPKEYISLAGASTLLILIFFGLSAGTLTSIVGFVYPAVKSLQALEHRATGEITQWLIYWVVYTFFHIIESFVDTLLYWIPFYYAFKVAFLMWAMLPQTRGAKFLYDSFLKDFLKANESKIDGALKDAKKSADRVVAKAKEAAVDAATENVKKDE